MANPEEQGLSHIEEQALQSLMEQIRKQVADYGSNLVGELNHTCRSMEARQKKLNEQVDLLSEQLTTSRAELESEHQANAQRQRSNEGLTKERLALQQQLQELQTRHHALSESFANKATLAQGQAERIASLEGELKSASTRINELTLSHDEEKNSAQARLEQLNEAEAKAEAFAIKVARYAEAEQSHKQQLDSYAGEARTMKRQLEYAEDRIVQLEAELKSLRVMNDKLNIAQQQLTRDMEETCNRAEEINSAFRRCKIELEKRDDELEALQQRLEQVLSER